MPFRLPSWPVLILVAGAAWGGDSPPIKPVIVDLGTFTKQLDGWAFTAGAEYPGASGTLAWLGTAGHTAPGSASLKADFSLGGRYVGMRIRKVDRLASEFACWVKPDGPIKSIMVRLTDAGDQTFQYRLPLDAASKEWQQIAVVPGTTVAESSYAGRKDGKWQGHIAAIVIGLSKDAGIQNGTATCLIDDVTVTTAGP